MTLTLKYMARPALAALVGALMAAPAFATATWTWALDVNGTSTPNPCTGAAAVNNYTMSTNCTASGTANKATFTGWSDTGGKTGTTEVGGGTFEASKMYSYGTNGYGVVNKFENSTITGPHAADNVGALDLFLVKFDSAVSLSEVKVGWNGTTAGTTGYNDSDMSIYRFIPGTSSGALTGLTAANMTTKAADGSGWQLVKNYSNASSTVDLRAGSFDTGTSSWWLISAYNSNSGGSFGSSDAFKLLSVGAVAGGKIPEPASLALLAVAGIGAAAARRRSARRG